MAKKDGTNGAKIGRHSRNPSSKLQATRSARSKRLRIEAAIKRGDTSAGVQREAESYRRFGVASSEYCPKSATPEQRSVSTKPHHDQRAWHLGRAQLRSVMRSVYPCSKVRSGQV